MNAADAYVWIRTPRSHLRFEAISVTGRIFWGVARPQYTELIGGCYLWIGAGFPMYTTTRGPEWLPIRLRGCHLADIGVSAQDHTTVQRILLELPTVDAVVAQLLGLAEAVPAPTSMSFQVDAHNDRARIHRKAMCRDTPTPNSR